VSTDGVYIALDGPLARIPLVVGAEMVRNATIFCELPWFSSIQKVRLVVPITETTGIAISLSAVTGLPPASLIVMDTLGVTNVFGYVTTMVEAELPIFPFVLVAVRIFPEQGILPDVPPPISPIVTVPASILGK
jgi:hypothetical protein